MDLQFVFLTSSFGEVFKRKIDSLVSDINSNEFKEEVLDQLKKDGEINGDVTMDNKVYEKVKECYINMIERM